MEEKLSKHFFYATPRNIITVLLVSVLTYTTIPIAFSSTAKKTKKSQELHNLPINESFTFSTKKDENLLPMPSIKINEASKNVTSSRNPFEELEGSFTDSIGTSAMRLTGIAQAGNSVVAMISSSAGDNIFSVGDAIGNNFIVRSISSEEEKVMISNGSRELHLSLIR